jgi:hypothetical protein
MIIIFLGLSGLIIGALTARKRSGNRKDIAQYAVGYAMAFMIVGLILTVFVDRLIFAA